MNTAPSTAKFMHDLPANRGFEVTDALMYGSQSIVFQQAESRMHLTHVAVVLDAIRAFDL